MKKKNGINHSRREFLRDSSLAAAGFFIIPRHVLGRGFIAPSDKLNVAAIGAGGKGADDIDHFYKSGKAEIVCLCDADDRQAVDSRKHARRACRLTRQRASHSSISAPDGCLGRETRPVATTSGGSGRGGDTIHGQVWCGRIHGLAWTECRRGIRTREKVAGGAVHRSRPTNPTAAQMRLAGLRNQERTGRHGAHC